MKKSRLAWAGLVLGMTIFGASPALAHSATSPDGGAEAHDNAAHTRFAVTDVKCDGFGAYGYWNREDGDHKLYNSQGCGNKVVKTDVSVTFVKACIDRSLAVTSQG
jgi:hypothetical protein